MLLDSGKYDVIFKRKRYLIVLKSGYLYFWHNYVKIKTGSDDNFLLDKTLTLHNTVRIIKSVFLKNQNLYGYNVFLEKCSYQLVKK